MNADNIGRFAQQDQNEYDLAWSLFLEVRKEILEFQRIRTHIIGFKITFVSAAFAALAANIDKIPNAVLVVPSFAAVFFDFLIASYTFNIRRAGYYCARHLEPMLRSRRRIPRDFMLWEEFMCRRESRQHFIIFGNLGITLLAIIPGVIALCVPFKPLLSIPAMFALILIGTYDIYACILPNRFRKTNGALWSDATSSSLPATSPAMPHGEILASAEGRSTDSNDDSIAI